MKYIKNKSIKYLKFNWDYNEITIPGKYIYSFKYIPYGKNDGYIKRYEMKYLYIEIDLDYLNKNNMLDMFNNEEGIWDIDLVFKTDAESNFLPPYIPRNDFKNPLQKSRIEKNIYIIEWR